MKEPEVYYIGNWVLPYLINGDPSVFDYYNMSDEEKKNVDQWFACCEDGRKGHWDVVDDGIYYTTCELTGKFSECAKVAFIPMD